MFGEAYCDNDDCADYATPGHSYCPACEEDCAQRMQAPSPHDDDDVLTDREIECHGEGGIDRACERLIERFGSTPIDGALIARIERLTGMPAHPFLKSGLFCSHRSLDELLDAFEQGEQFYLYTGRGASAGMHLGHLVPFLFTAYLQKAFKVPCVIQLTDDEKFLYKGLDFQECATLVQDNVHDILACGFDPHYTYVFSNFKAIGFLYPHACAIQRHLTCNQVCATFGIVGTDSPGKLAFPAMQMAPALASTFPDVLGGRKLRCLIPCGLDQDPYFRLTRDVAHKMGQHKPAVLQSKFLPSITGSHTKMGAAGGILLSDSPEAVMTKLSGAFSGGQETLAEQQALGANLAKDVALQYLHTFAELAFPEFRGPEIPVRSAKLQKRIGPLKIARGDLGAVDHAYAQGQMMSSEVKQMAAAAVSAILAQHQEARRAIRGRDIQHFMTRRQLG